jgi:RNA polymerase sigma-70 factor, ECF subfamily
MVNRTDRDREAFSTFYRLHLPRVARSVFVVVGAKEEARDLSQETFARVWDTWEKVQAADQPLHYVLAIAMNLALSDRRRARHLTRLLAPLASDRIDGTPEREPPTEERVDLVQALRELPQMQRASLALVYLCDLDSAEAASILKISPSTLRVHISRAKERLRSSPVLAETPEVTTSGEQHQEGDRDDRA